MDKTGVIFMWSGALLATLCGLLMFLNKFGSVIPFIKPTKLVTSGPYALVRHPMMWALLFVLFGEVITYCSLFTFLWLTIWSRLSYIYICDYEDPYLLQCFGEEYLQYSKKVPRWIPGSKPQPII